MYNQAIPLSTRNNDCAGLRGTLVEKHPNQAILDVGGVGYDVTIPISTFSALPETGKETFSDSYPRPRGHAGALRVSYPGWRRICSRN